MLRRTLHSKQQALFRSTAVLLSGGLKPYHEWHLHEPLLQNYEGWRILDNPKMTLLEIYTSDFAGIGRHLDPIIDDPRLTHRQRVCRLYRWALKEFNAYLASNNNFKFNIGYKVVRKRFEKYRYVTDPGMCDMMVRESQKYLREMCNTVYMRRDPRSSYSVQTLTNPMFHPDHCQVYDHWTPYEEQLYGDAKLHRYANHHPNMVYQPEFYDRFGDPVEPRRLLRTWVFGGIVMFMFIQTLVFDGFFWHEGWYDDYHDILQKQYKQETIQAMETFERNHRNRYSQASTLSYDWDLVLGKVNQKRGFVMSMGNFTDQTVVPRNPFEGQPNK